MMSKYLIFLAVFGVCSCTTNDYRTRFSIKGFVDATTEKDIVLTLVDLSLDDTRENRIILEEPITKRSMFNLDKSYFWGRNTSFNIFKKDKVSILVESEGCISWQESFDINTYRDKGVVALDIGRINLECK